MKQLFLILLLGIFFYSCDKGIPDDGPYVEVTSYGTISEYTENISLNILTDDNKKFVVENIDEIIEICAELNKGDRVWFGGIRNFIKKENGISIYNLKIIELNTVTEPSDVLYKSTLTQHDYDNFSNIPLAVFASLTEKRCNIQYYCNYKENTQPEISFVIDDTDSNYMKISESGELGLNVKVYTNATGTHNSNSSYIPLIYTSFPVEQYTKMEGVKKLILNFTSLAITEGGSAVTTESITWNKEQ